jgi:hypothetical protein
LRGSVIAAGLAIACHLGPPQPLVALDPGQLVSHVDTLVLRAAGDSVAVSVVQLELSSDSIVGRIVESVHDTIVQHVVVTFDAHLRPVEVHASESYQVNLNYSVGRLRGIIVAKSTSGMTDSVRIDMPIDSLTQDRRSLLFIAPSIPLAPGRVFTVPIFDSWYRRVVQLDIAVGKRTRITVPAGTFDAYRLDLTAYHGMFPQRIYVSVDSPRRVLRIERPREQVTIELVNSHWSSSR